MTEHTNIASALVAALAELTVVEKGRTAKIEGREGRRGYEYEYADIADVVKITRPVLAENGLVALTPVHDHGNGLACTVTLLHTSGERLDFGPFPFPHGKDAQATGSMVTYHRRYALVAALGMAAGDDDDGAAAVARPAVVVDAPVSADNAEALRARCEERGVSVSEVVMRGTNGRTGDPAEVLRSEVPAVKAAMDQVAAALKLPEAPPEGGGEVEGSASSSLGGVDPSLAEKPALGSVRKRQQEVGA